MRTRFLRSGFTFSGGSLSLAAASMKRLAAAIALLVAASPFVRANHIDFFDDGPFSQTNNAANPANEFAVTGIPTAGTLGGRRDVTLDSDAGTVSFSLNPTGAGANDDFAVFSAAAGSRGSVTVAYGRAGDLNANFLDIPNSMLQWDRIRLTLQGASSGSVSVTLFSDGQGFTTLVRFFSFANGGNVDFLYADFMASSPAFTADTFRDIDLVNFTIFGNDGATYNIASFDRNGSVVPEPSSTVLLGIAAAGITVAYLRRRRR